MDDTLSPDDLFEHNVYACAHCGQANQIFVDTSATWMFMPGGIRQQQTMAECEFCCRFNLVLVESDLVGNTRNQAQRAD